MARYLLIAIALFFTTATLADAESSSVAWKRFQHLQHGIAVSGWFSESGNYSMQQLRAHTTPADLEHIHQLGFDHIRIPVAPEVFQCDGEWDSCERIQFLDQVIQKALASDLYVILDFHPNPQYTHQLVSSGQAAEKYLRLWSQIAEHYGKLDSDRIVLEVRDIDQSALHGHAGGCVRRVSLQAGEDRALPGGARVDRLHVPHSQLGARR